ncbi:hypothetical protein Bca52824_043849 [Brassica carinata]|uniref:Uncharacterized protein n=1 Tax=Brassica carinata TaxID=52824 RepID=A0A8X7UYQ7_BRACI|nr:hypothetical protein Bca52824_043849 [Brassica carinata]
METLTVLLMVSLAQTKHQCHHVPALIILKGSRGKEDTIAYSSGSIVLKFTTTSLVLEKILEVQCLYRMVLDRDIIELTFVSPTIEWRAKYLNRYEIGFNLPLLERYKDVKEEQGGECRSKRDFMKVVNLSYWHWNLRFVYCKSQAGL